ncbi:peptide-methionine (S)-S-oxide reductase MsrA [Roseovarius nubinhibens]|uniref:peptide-methionine (S)-S-oxide reductase MsrA n=1 Tax=Roseovarius nubinhibens TaxID=314263 RepID=UPI001C08C469|nr:peptide-methionine (S)-S-oxide reductase MsrA [Roseovarius nubinhibens]MBU3000051.1 peptide-methionine (S)-S-oxide reductase MsrA [Roseovarius nubinhibens]
MEERALLAGGSFWGLQHLLRDLDGVLSSRVGYTGGDSARPTYRDHGTHAEAVEIRFDPRVLGYRALLEYFFRIHDPTTPDRQGPFIGLSYRSAIFYMNDPQKFEAIRTIADINGSGVWPAKLVTEVLPADAFWEAEPEHQDYLQRVPDAPCAHHLRRHWVLPRKR